MRLLRAILLIACTAGVASAIGIPLPELQGEYNGEVGYERVITVQLNVDPSRVETVGLRLRGNATSGQLICDGAVEASMWPVDFHGFITDPFALAGWSAEQFVPKEGQPGETVDFDIVMFFHEFRDPSWAFLSEGSLDLEFSAYGPPYIGICSATREPQSTIEEAMLILRLAQLVPIEGKSWSAVKAQYE